MSVSSNKHHTPTWLKQKKWKTKEIIFNKETFEEKSLQIKKTLKDAIEKLFGLN